MSVAVEPLSKLLASDEVDPIEMRARLEALGDDELFHYGLRAFRMNMMALFGDRWDAAKIFRTAREAALSKLWLGWLYHHHDLPRLGLKPPPTRLENFPLSTIQTIQAQGRGIVVVSFHVGHMRHLPSDIAHAGIDVLLPLAADAYENYQSAQQGNPNAALWKHLRCLCVETSGGSLALARGLARGACIIAALDGNTGIDGPRGDDRRSIVRMLNTEVRVKNGLIAMAARFGAVILPVVAVTRNGVPSCECLPTIDPRRPLAGDAAAEFVEQATSTIYAWFGQLLVGAAGEWCGADLFHQWRLPRQLSERSMQDIECDLRSALEQGSVLILDPSRMMELPGEEGHTFVDVQTTRCYRFPLAEHEFMQRISTRDVGIDNAWLEEQGGGRRERLWRLLCTMAGRHAVIPVSRSDSV